MRDWDLFKILIVISALMILIGCAMAVSTRLDKKAMVQSCVEDGQKDYECYHFIYRD